jgi:hypothetical protein
MPAKKKTKPHIPAGGVLFTAGVFIILSMMVIEQSDKVRGLYRQLLTQPQEKSLEMLAVEQQLQNSQNRLSHCQKSIDLHENIVQSTIDELDKLSSLLDPNSRTKIIVRRTSPDKKLVAVIYGVGGDAKGFYVLGHGRLLASVDPDVEGTAPWKISNVRWVDQDQMTYDVTVGGKTTNKKISIYYPDP